MLDCLVASGQFRDCFIFLPKCSRLRDDTVITGWAVMAEENSVANPIKTLTSLSLPKLCDAKL